MSLLWDNAARASIIAGLGGAFMLIGKLTIAFMTVFVSYLIMDNVEKYKDNMSSYSLSLMVNFILNYNNIFFRLFF